MYAVPKEGGNNNSTGFANNSSNNNNSVKSLVAVDAEIENLQVTNIDVKGELNIDNIDTTTVNAESVNATNLKGKKIETGKWIIEEDIEPNLVIHSEVDKTFKVKPSETEVLVVSKNETKISNKLDLTNESVGTSIEMGTSKAESMNTNLKSIREDGFYITDNNNHVAVGIANNYVQIGTETGSPNFKSGLVGWKIQPDGSAEFQNIKVNGNMDLFTITYNEMKGTNGILLVTDTDSIKSVIHNESTEADIYTFTLSEYPVFQVDDIIKLQYKTTATNIISIVFLVLEVDSETNSIKCQAPYEHSAFMTSCVGKYLIRIGNKTDENRQTIIKINPYDGGYIDFIKGCNSFNDLASYNNNGILTDVNVGLSSVTRLGKLDGVVHSGKALDGYGLYSENAYLTGEIENVNGTWALKHDGSGSLANGAIQWGEDGTLTIRIGNKNVATIGDIEESEKKTEAKIEANNESIVATVESNFSKAGINITDNKVEIIGGTLKSDDNSWYLTNDESKIGGFNVDNSELTSDYGTTDSNNVYAPNLTLNGVQGSITLEDTDKILNINTDDVDAAINTVQTISETVSSPISDTTLIKPLFFSQGNGTDNTTYDLTKYNWFVQDESYISEFSGKVNMIVSPESGNPLYYTKMVEHQMYNSADKNTLLRIYINRVGNYENSGFFHFEVGKYEIVEGTKVTEISYSELQKKYRFALSFRHATAASTRPEDIYMHFSYVPDAALISNTNFRQIEKITLEETYNYLNNDQFRQDTHASSMVVNWSITAKSNAKTSSVISSKGLHYYFNQGTYNSQMSFVHDTTNINNDGNGVRFDSNGVVKLYKNKDTTFDGGFFKMYQGGEYVINVNYPIPANVNSIVFKLNQANGNYYFSMPENVEAGHRIYVKLMSPTNVVLTGQFVNADKYTDSAIHSDFTLNERSMFFLYTGSYWILFYCG